MLPQRFCLVSTHSRPKAAGLVIYAVVSFFAMFQHTAARRRLGNLTGSSGNGSPSFNTQPPEGGWWEFKDVGNNIYMFQHTAARRRLDGIVVLGYQYR